MILSMAWIEEECYNMEENIANYHWGIFLIELWKQCKNTLFIFGEERISFIIFSYTNRGELLFYKITFG